MEFWLPYGTTEVPVRIPDQNFQRIIEPPERKEPSPELQALLHEAFGKPSGTTLQNMVKPGSTAGVLVDPIIPEQILNPTIETVRAYLAKLGAVDIKIIARTRSTAVVPSNIKMVNPSSGSFVETGRTSHNTRVLIDEGFLQCDTKILIGMVQPHFTSSFTGGPDLILPGISSLETISANRSLAVTGNRESNLLNYQQNQVFTDSLEATRTLGGNLYLIDLVPDESGGGIAAAYSGEVESTFKESIMHFHKLHFPSIDNRPEIIVVSPNSPSSSDLYHAVRILPFLSNITKRDGSTIILAAECRSGVGDDNFMTLSKMYEDRRGVQSELKRKFKLGGHVALLLKEALEKNRIQLVSVLPDAYCRMFGLKPSRTVSAAVQSAIRAEGKDARILIVPMGSITIPVIETLAAAVAPPVPSSPAAADHA